MSIISYIASKKSRHRKAQGDISAGVPIIVEKLGPPCRQRETGAGRAERALWPPGTWLARLGTLNIPRPGGTP